jgi:hypothetical protein
MMCALGWGLAIAGWGCFSFALANNVTSKKAFVKKFGDRWKQVRKEWAAGNTSAN